MYDRLQKGFLVSDSLTLPLNLRGLRFFTLTPPWLYYMGCITFRGV